MSIVAARSGWTGNGTITSALMIWPVPGRAASAGVLAMIASAAMMPVSAAALRLAVYPAALPVTYSPAMSVLCQLWSTGTW